MSGTKRIDVSVTVGDDWPQAGWYEWVSAAALGKAGVLTLDGIHLVEDPTDPNRPFPDFPPEWPDYIRLAGVTHRKERYWGGPGNQYVMHRCTACGTDWECEPVAKCRRLERLKADTAVDADRPAHDLRARFCNARPAQGVRVWEPGYRCPVCEDKGTDDGAKRANEEPQVGGPGFGTGGTKRGPTVGSDHAVNDGVS